MQCESKDDIILSILIPTKDRYDVLEKCLESFLLLPKILRFEIVVFDSSNSRKNLDLSKYGDLDIKYIHYEISGFCATFSKALEYINGVYVCIIGDDDTILPGLLDMAKWADDNMIDSVTSSSSAGYIWPGVFRILLGDRDSDRLMVRYFSGNMKYIDAKRELKNVISSGFQDFNLLPKIYHGLVKTDNMHKVKQMYGDFFIGSSPDISASIALVDFCVRHIYIDYPLTLPGSSVKSGAGSSLSGKHFADLEDSPLAPFFSKWPKFILPIYTVQTMWAFSGTYVVERGPHTNLMKFFSKEKLIASILVYNLSDYKLIIHQIKLYNKIEKVHIFNTLRYCFYYISRRLISLFNRGLRIGMYNLIIDKKGLGDIARAQNYLVKDIDNKMKNPINFGDIQ